MIREADSNDDNQISEKEFETLFLSSDELRGRLDEQLGLDHDKEGSSPGRGQGPGR